MTDIMIPEILFCSLKWKPNGNGVRQVLATCWPVQAANRRLDGTSNGREMPTVYFTGYIIEVPGMA